MDTTTKPKIFTGALIDSRLDEEKEKDFEHEELFAAGAIVWKEKAFNEVKRYTPRNQSMSLSCVANGGAITLEAAELLETGKVVVFSHKDIYIRRANKPWGGMGMDDLMRILREGAAYESQVPSNGLTETPINQQYPITNEITQARARHAQKASVTIKTKSMDSVAQALEMGIPVVSFWFFSAYNDYQEYWNSRPQVIDPTLPLYDPKDDNRVLHHQSIIVDYGTMNGVKGFFVQDSAGVGTGAGEHGDLRFIDANFFVVRNYALAYGVDKANLDFDQPEKPHYRFTRSLKVGMDGDDVKELQRVLVYEGCMILKDLTTHFRGATLKGVKNLQEKYKDQILTPVGLKAPTGFVGAMTLKFLNEKYAI